MKRDGEVHRALIFTSDDRGMAIDGDDLHVLSRSGDHRAGSAHDASLITFHTVRRFGELVY